MENLIIQLIGLPDELLVMIFKKLNNVQLLYTLFGINRELDRILSDSIFTRYLVLSRNLSNDVICPIVDTVLDRFCSQILPQIRYKINFLTLETSSVERILLTADYPNLYGLGLYNIDEKSAKRFFTGKIFN
ncbi:unnamed protein product [Rotaria sp. Silwood2]|nr:unnamed protein product [Rotaria sp. Silwood2]CAF3029806.1 unnamed protein product [Rotaria sp. Silwood2]CAF3063896.1 unnamed protein product [Rotaria sp. Silwood2]